VTFIGTELDSALEVFADFADLKSPWTAGHSRGVAMLAGSAGETAGLTAHEVRLLRRAALVQDLGRLGVPNSIWDKPGPLSAGEAERVRLHPYYTSRMLARSEPLDELGQWAASHHERLDGSGYHRGVRGSALSRPERVLAAADVFQAMREPRPHRPALASDVAVAELRAMARASLLDGESVECVIGAAGEKARPRPERPSGLSDREVEVLRCAARGLLNKETARQLGISPKTVAHHLQHAYDKIGVSTRGAAALFAMENDLM
jgi:HD-GYP domain-containing protein (c-di-GMP phosphodiesterase class II)